MENKSISNNQIELLMFIYCISSYLLFSMGGELKQDAWIGTIIAVLGSIPFIFIYGKIMELYPEKNIYQILDIMFGKIIGTILNLLIIIYISILSTLILRNFVDFIKITSLLNTPAIVIMSCIGSLIIYILYYGIEVLAAWAKFFLRIILAFFILTLILVIPQMDINNLFPILNTSIEEMLINSYRLVTFPFTELFIFTTFFDYVKHDKKTKNVFIKSLVISGITAFIFCIVNILLLGGELYSSFYYSGYESVRRIKIQGEYQRLEIVVAIAFTILQFLEISYCILGICKGFKNVLNVKNYEKFLFPVVSLVIIFASKCCGSILKSFEIDLNIWPIYGGIMQLLFPTIILIIGIIQKKIKKQT